MTQLSLRGSWMLILAALMGAASVGLSAAAAHGLAGLVGPEHIERLQTANRYLTHYSLVILVLGLFYQFRPWPGLRWVVGLFAVGTGIFCGALYILCVTEISWFARLTPIGGLTLLGAWLLLAGVVWRQGAQSRRES
ncbi:DUF423 domain-containing protein [Motiliproteus coralliicola]|nr:DUF423 domain-containing protein [Motiliproteus coralliicola]